MLNPDGEFDVALNAFWTDSATSVRAKGATLKLYASAIARFCDFLWYARSSGGERRTWRDATSRDRSAFFHWRNVDVDGPRVAANTWNTEVAALDMFYRFEVEVGNVPRSPMRSVERYRPRGDRSGLAVRGPAEKRLRKEVLPPWLSPGEYSSWCRVGVRGFLPSGGRDESFRGSQSGRNVSFMDLMFGSGLRLQEQATLLVSEIPALEGAAAYTRLWVSAATAKYESERYVLVARNVLRSIHTYLLVDRSESIDRARRSGAYGLISQKIIVPEGATSFRNGDGTKVALVDATPAERLRLYEDSADGLTPLTLWLTEAGTPMRLNTWQKIFSDANKRVQRLGGGPAAHAHKLRHSWATITVAQLERRYRALRKQPDSERGLVGDPLDWVSRRLGHRHVETTLIYVHSVRELEAETVLQLIPDDVAEIAAPTSDDIISDRFDIAQGTDQA
ncbi:tyrosine-type recombinase/integrase [Curtobacterium flaccumfaciens]|nr:tyrosine-type recombinase/integrase [Curtobacterium flaccumfaciens]